MEIIEAQVKEAERLLAGEPENPGAEDPNATVHEDPEAGQRAGEQVIPPAPEKDPGAELEERLRKMEEINRNLLSRMEETNATTAGLREKLAAFEQRPVVEPPAPPVEPEEEIDPEIATLAQELPEYVKLARYEAKLAAREAVKEIAPKVKQMEEAEAQRNKQKEEEAELRRRKEHYAEILKAHPEAIELTNSPEFQGWMEAQEEGRQAVMMNHLNFKPEAVVKIINAYKKDQAEASAQPPPANKPSATADVEVRKPRPTTPTVDPSGGTLTEEEMAQLPTIIHKLSNAEQAAMWKRVEATLKLTGANT